MAKNSTNSSSKNSEKLRNRVGMSLKKWRTGEGLTLVELGDKIKLGQPSLSDFENGKTLPSFLTIRALKKKIPSVDWDKILFP